MSYHLRVLHALVRLSRSNSAARAQAISGPTPEALLARAGGSASSLRDALVALAELGMVQSVAVRAASGTEHPELRLTMQGLAVGTAYAAAARRRAQAVAVRESPRLASAPVERRKASRGVARRAA